MPRSALLLALLATPALADQAAPLPGAWTCLTPEGQPAFAFSVLEGGRYADPEGREGALSLPGPGMIEMTDGTWAGTLGSHVPGVMALMLPGAKVPVICTGPEGH